MLAISLLLLDLSPALSHDNVASVLKEARAAADPVKKIEMLDEAINEQSFKGEALSSLHFERGIAYKEIKDYFRALEDFNTAIAYTRKIVPALAEKAHCLVMVDQLEEAARLVEVVLSTSPGLGHAYVLKGMMYEKENFLAKAEDEYTRALNYEPQSILALEMRSQLRLREGKPRKALEDANALSRLAPNNPEVFLTRGRINMKLKDYAAALADYRQAEAMLPGDDTVLEEKALVFFETNEPHKALEALSGYAVKHPGEVKLLVLQARAHILLKNYPEAERILRRALAKNPKHSPAYLYRGVVHARTGDQDQALWSLNRALEIDANLVEAYKERARIFMALGEHVRAGLDLTQAVNLDPADGEILAMRGLTNVSRMLYDAAIADFTRALESLANDPRILYDRAAVYVLVDEQRLALADLEGVLRARPNAARALNLRGAVHFNLGNLTKAREDFQRSGNLAANDPLVWNNRGFFHYKMGEYNSAMDCYERALTIDPRYQNARYNLNIMLQKRQTPDFTTEAAQQTPDSTATATLAGKHRQ
jgi:tetratricopeptide (TPR) repeat protein